MTGTAPLRQGDTALALVGEVETPAEAQLYALAQTIQREHERLVEAASQMVVHAIRIGEALLEAKTLVPPGEWTRWELAAKVMAGETPSTRSARASERRPSGVRNAPDRPMTPVETKGLCDALIAMHHPDLGLDRSVSLRDVVEALREGSAGSWHGDYWADYIERVLGGGA